MCREPCRKTKAGANDALGIDAVMGIEILVLGRDEGLLDQGGNCGGRQIEAPFAGIFGEQAAVGRVNARHDRRLIVLELGVVRQILLVLPYDAGKDRRRPDEDDRAGREHEADKTGDSAHLSIEAFH